MESDRIPANKIAEISNWQLPELSGDPVVYITREEGTNTAQFPELGKCADSHDTDSNYPNRRRVTAVELEALLVEAREQGYREGFEKGLEDGGRQGREQAMELGRQEADTRLDAALQVVDQLEQQLPAALNLHNQAERQFLLQILEKLVRTVTLQELAMQGADMEAVVDQALSCLSEQDQVLEVRVSEQDFITLGSLQSGRNWKLLADPTLQTGDCIVESRRALLDYSVEQRLDEAMSALRSQISQVVDT